MSWTLEVVFTRKSQRFKFVFQQWSTILQRPVKLQYFNPWRYLRGSELGTSVGGRRSAWNNWNATTYYQSINKFNTWFIELWFCFIVDVFILVFQRPQLKNGNDDRQAAINCTYQVIIWHHVSEILISNNTLDNYIQATLSGGFRSFWFVFRALNSIMRF